MPQFQAHATEELGLSCTSDRQNQPCPIIKFRLCHSRRFVFVSMETHLLCADVVVLFLGRMQRRKAETRRRASLQW